MSTPHLTAHRVPQPDVADSHLVHDELSSPAVLADDCRHLLGSHRRLEQAARTAVRPAPSIHYEDFPREVSKGEIRVSDAAARLAGALHLHLD